MLTIDQKTKSLHHNLGHFRVLVSNDPRATDPLHHKSW